jgi:hypothetical protein
LGDESKLAGFGGVLNDLDEVFDGEGSAFRPDGDVDGLEVFVDEGEVRGVVLDGVEGGGDSLKFFISKVFDIAESVFSNKILMFHLGKFFLMEGLNLGPGPSETIKRQTILT